MINYLWVRSCLKITAKQVPNQKAETVFHTFLPSVAPKYSEALKALTHNGEISLRNIISIKHSVWDSGWSTGLNLTN